MAWANDGGAVWNATKCSPLAFEPAAIGQPCLVEGSGVSGIDDCAADAICWGVDPGTNQGTCVPRCGGSQANPQCPEELACMVAFEDDVVIVCLPPCDPLSPTCAEDEVCSHYADVDPGAGIFVCQPIPPFEPQPYGMPCGGLQVCDDGHACVEAQHVPGCAGERCCTLLGEIEPPPACPDATQSCIPLGGPSDSCFCGVR